jgi:ribosomal protein L1
MNYYLFLLHFDFEHCAIGAVCHSPDERLAENIKDLVAELQDKLPTGALVKVTIVSRTQVA